MGRYFVQFFVLGALILFEGCGEVAYDASSTTTTTTTTSNTNVTGQFLDAYVADMNYSCSSGLSGVTSSTGSFTCQSGDSVTFYLGGVAIGSASAQTTITPYTLFPNSVDSAVNLARLLQSIDNDADLTNDTITINKTLEASLPQNLDFADSNFTAVVEAALSITLESAYDAQSRLNNSIVASGETLPTTATLPVADAGADQSVATGSLVTLDGSNSVAQSYLWSITSKPAGSGATLSSSVVSSPTFTADVAGTYIITLVVDDGAINSVSDTVTITVTDGAVPPPSSSTNTAPLINVMSSYSVLENQTSAFTISASDVDGDALLYSISGTDSASFSVNATSGVVTFVSAPDFEVKTSYTLTAAVSDGSLSDEQNVTVSILNVVETPSLSATTLSIDENQPSGTTVGAVVIQSHGDSVISGFTLSGTGSSNFSINTSGVVTTAASLDYEAKTQYLLEVYATNNEGDSTPVTLTLNVNNVADVKPVLVDTVLSFREDVQVGATIGSVTIDTEGDAPITSIALSGTGATNFSVATDGTISVASGASFDYETTTQYILSAQATNSVGTSSAVSVELNVNNVLDEVPVIADSSGSVDENASLGTLVGTLSITSVGDSPIIVIDLNGTGSSYFSIATDGNVTLSSSGVLDFESVPSYTLTAVATNSVGESNSATFSITVGDVPEVPVLQNTSMSIMENELSGAVVGSILFETTGDSAITDINLSGTGSSNFISDTSGQITLSSTSAIDFETTPSYTLSAVATNAAGASASATISIAIEDYVFNPVKMADITAGDAEASDYFGSSVAVSGNYIVVGAPNEEAGTTSDGGSAYLYKKEDNGSVTQLVKLTAGTPTSQEYFGTSVAIDGDVIVVGAPGGSSDIGDAYLFVLDANGSVSATQQINLGSADTFGTAVAMSGSYIVVGAPSRASAHLYKLDGSNVASKVADITEGGASTDGYGASVAIDGNYIVIGAGDKDTLQIADGATYVYEIDPATDAVSQIGALSSPSAENNDHFGSSVGVSGSYVVAGAYGDNSNTGAGYLYKISGGSVSLTSTFYPNSSEIVVAGDYFAYSIAISGKYVVAGAYKKDLGATSDVGSAYIYEIDSNDDSTTFLKVLDAGNVTASDFYGNSISINGDLMVVGAPFEDSAASDAGSAYLFDGEPAP